MSGSRTSREIRRALLLCACALSVPRPLSGLDPNQTIGQYITTLWNSRHSFPGGGINALAQTPDGYLWIGAENGLVRFDGVSFRLLEHANTPSLPAGPVLGLTVDSQGRLWVRMDGPYVLRYRGESFEQMYYVERQEHGATAIARGAGGDVLIAPPGSPERYSAGKFTPIVSSGSAGGLPMSIAETADGAVWIGMRDTGLLCVRAGHGSEVPGLPDQKVNVLLPGTGAELWIGTDSGLARWDGNSITRSGIPAGLWHSSILALARDRDSNVWISTPAGIARLDPGGSLVRETAGNGPGLVHAIFEDREGSLWLGGSGGLMQLRDSAFLSYTGAAAEGGSVYVDGLGRAWIAPSGGGLQWIRGAENHVVVEPGFDRTVIYSLAGGADELWAGLKDGGVTQLREEGGVLQARTYTEADGLAPGAVYAVYRGRDGTIWAGTLRGAVSHIEKGHITTYTAANGLSGDAITTIQESADGVIWAGTAGGLQSFRGGSWRKYSGEDGMPPGRVNTLAIDADGVLWIGSSAGLLYWSGSRIESAHKVPSSLERAIYGLAADDAGNLWAATDDRVVRVSRAALLGRSTTPVAVREFGTADGLPSTRGTRCDHSVVRDRSGRIWFSLQGGLCVVNPSRPAAPAPINVESVEVDGLPLGTGAAARYPSDRRRVVFNFIAVSLAVPWRVRYRYLLEGYDRDWSQPTESREAAYTNLAPARYTFRVMASNSEGLWNGAPASVTFEVEPQLAQTWWFRLTALCLAAALIFAGIRYRMTRVRSAMNLRFEARLAERTHIAQELHDTLLQGFLSASMQVHVAADMLPADSPSRPLLTRALQLMHQVIEEGRNTLKGLRASGSPSVPLESAFSHIQQEVGAQGKAAFRVVVEGQRCDLYPLLQDEIYRIGREAVMNAFRHANARHIEVELRYAADGFHLLVRDDGSGIDEHVLQTGRDGHWGLVGMRERAERIGAQLHVCSRPSAGTEIQLAVPANVAFLRRRA